MDTVTDKKIIVIRDISNESGETIVSALQDGGEPVVVGDVFTVKYDIDWDLYNLNYKIFRENPDARNIRDNFIYPDPVNIIDINLTVVKINLYKKENFCLPLGHAKMKIVLDGQGLDNIHSNCFLET